MDFDDQLNGFEKEPKDGSHFPSMETQDVPWVQQYWDLKTQHPQSLLLYRLGDFYEMFFEDAHKGSEILGVSKTRRGQFRGEPIPMSGFPFHALDHYLAKLVKAGLSVAICEQMVDGQSESAKKTALMKREVVRVVTPGTVVEEGSLESKKENWLMAALGEPERIGYAGLELGSGRLSLFEPVPLDDFLETLRIWGPAEILTLQGSLFLNLKQALPGSVIVVRPAQAFDGRLAEAAFQKQFGVNLQEQGLNAPALQNSVGALGAILHYLGETHRSAIPHLRPPQRGVHPHTMRVDAATLKNLEIFPATRDSRQLASLFELMDVTQTPMGARCLRRWFLRPLRRLDRLQDRQTSVASFLQDPWSWQSLLKPMGDLERSLSRIAMHLARPRDWGRLRDALEAARALQQRLEAHLQSDSSATSLLQRCLACLSPLPELEDELKRALVEDLPPHFKEGQVIRKGYHPELDRWRSLMEQGHQVLESQLQQEKNRWKLESLKVGYSSVYGYYFQLNRVESHRAPPTFERCQTLKHAERFLAPQLKAYEQEILVAEQRSSRLERQLYQALHEKIQPFLKPLQKLADAWAILDACVALAERCVTLNLKLPELVSKGFEIRLQGSRHPLVEATHPGQFTTNDISMGPERHCLVLTGPNMGGKSTYLRQAALAVFMSQIGGGVAAEKAKLSIFDQIFTRIGASDDIIAGRSTFMVEMSEVAHFLKHATGASLIVVDEVGRGTTTRDGMALAWAIGRALVKLRALTLFSTHFLEVAIQLARELGTAALQAEAFLESGQVRFLHHMTPGVASHAYGLEVASLAGVPPEVVEEAKQFQS